MTNKAQLCVIGAANVDLIGYPADILIFNDANIGSFETIFGGVGRNIAHNLSLLNFDTHFLTVFGDDEFAKQLEKSCLESAINTKGSIYLKNAKSSIFMAIMDKNNDLALGISAMDIYDNVPLDLIDNNTETLTNSNYIILDTNMPETILKHVTKQYANAKFALDGVSGVKALKAKTILSKLHILKVNLLEAELLSGIKLEKENYQELINYFITKGVQKVFITLGNKGVAFGTENYYKKLAAREVTATNTSGAGDAFMAGIIYGDFHNYHIDKTVLFAMECAKMTVQHKNTVHPELNANYIKKQLK